GRQAGTCRRSTPRERCGRWPRPEPLPLRVAAPTRRRPHPPFSEIRGDLFVHSGPAIKPDTTDIPIFVTADTTAHVSLDTKCEDRLRLERPAGAQHRRRKVRMVRRSREVLGLEAEAAAAAASVARHVAVVA